MAAMHIVVVTRVTLVASATEVHLLAFDRMDPSIQPISLRFWVTGCSAQPGLERGMRIAQA